MNIPRLYPTAVQSKAKKGRRSGSVPAGIVTPIPFDSAHNLLVQIHGSKKLLRSTAAIAFTLLSEPASWSCELQSVNVESPTWNASRFRNARP